MNKNECIQQTESHYDIQVITDDEEDSMDDISDIIDDPISLGDGVFGKLGSDADRLETAAAVSPDRKEEEVSKEEGEDSEAALDDFLLDLGLDLELEEDDEEASSSTTAEASTDFAATDIDAASEGVQMIRNSGSALEDEDEDDAVGLLQDEDEDDDIDDSGADTLPLDDFGDNDSMETEDLFDGDGGFDFDDGDYGDGGDSW